jgi:hypothetical protein
MAWNRTRMDNYNKPTLNSDASVSIYIKFWQDVLPQTNIRGIKESRRS